MCCSVSPNVKVKFSDTILYAAEVVNLQGKTVHVLGYQNQAQNNVKSYSVSPLKFWNRLKNSFSTTEKTKGNAMILPFPAVPCTMSKENVLDTEDCPKILKDIAKAVKPPPPRSLNPQEINWGMQSRAVQIFEAAGIYTVVLAQDARAIPDALDQVPPEKRPKLNPRLFDAYAKWYPNWTIALCCFNNDDLQEALPMLWWYEPMFPERLFLPALDCHTGRIPSLYSKVRVDHTIAVSSSFRENNNQGSYRPVYYSHNDLSNDLQSYILSQVMGEELKQKMRNGDFICQIDEVRKGVWNPVRTLPPNAF